MKCLYVSISVYCLFFVAKRFMIKILFFQCCRSGKVSECWNSTTCGSKGNSTQCFRDSNRCNVWENKGKLMKIKLRCSNIYFIWLCYLCCGFINIFGHQLSMSKITISRIHTFMVNILSAQYFTIYLVFISMNIFDFVVRSTDDRNLQKMVLKDVDETTVLFHSQICILWLIWFDMILGAQCIYICFIFSLKFVAVR